ncbi:DNA phosphorothioation-dependent restriction protein DptF [Bacillus sp. Marseille-P3661]|uniref:DNA phosphorothioation-dependent restriction protein DptF n=1 Tax=Bacillus sp. Marseille-P3661 TaxID=1936234 RepID=UPI000C8484B9|nr:DNA phosphorothioation-dependent restriction protein DptF [Bacillus sp. Marseille-P3661]
MSSEYFLGFLEEINPIAAQNAKKMEELLFHDPSSSIVKARLFAEAILNDVFKQENIDPPYLTTLFDKISFLSREGYIIPEMQQSLDTIRMSGNKAAHDGEFNDITVAFKLHKEMYKIGVWFYEVYSLEQLKVPVYETPKPPQKENIQEIVKKQILEILGAGRFEHDANVSQEDQVNNNYNEEKQKIINIDDEKIEPFNILTKDLGTGESYLLRELGRLKDSSQEAIENASQFSAFKNYLHVDRKIQLDLELILNQNKDRQKGNLILLCGSVGDGKSHLLAYLAEKKPELLASYTIFNDATESFSPNKNAMETLEEVLQDFSDQKIKGSTEKVILAINMGVLHNFINTQHKEFSYKQLEEFIHQSDLFSQNITTHFSDSVFDLLSFGDYHSFELTEKGPTSSFYLSLLQRVFNSSDQNPFYLAFKEDQNSQIHTMVHENYKLLQNPFVQEQIVQLIIQTIIKKKLVISARAFLNFVADLVIPDNVTNRTLMSEFEVLKFSLPNLLFNRKDRSPILQAMSQLDPIHKRSIFIDQLVVELNTLNEWDLVIDQYIKDQTPKKWLTPFVSKDSLTEHSFNLFFESFIRITFLTNKDFAINISDRSYIAFLQNLYYFNTGDRRKIKAFYDEIKTAIFKWKGSPKKEYIYLNKPSEKYRLSQKLSLRPTIDHLKPNTNDVLESFKSSIVLGYHGGNSDDKIFLDIDYPLYLLLTRVRDGYRPNKKDEEDAIRFVEFIEKIMAFGEKKQELLVHFPKDNRFYMIKRDDFGAFVFERE